MQAIPGELVPVKIDWHDERGWSDQESATSERMRRTWDTVPGQTYCRVQNFEGITKFFPPAIETVVGLQSVVNKDSVGSFPSIFYYKVV